MNSSSKKNTSLINIEFVQKDHEQPYFLIHQKKLHSLQITLLNEHYKIASHNLDEIIVQGKTLNQKDYQIFQELDKLYIKRDDQHTIVHSPYEEGENITIYLPENLFLRTFSFTVKSGEGILSNIEADQVSISNISGHMVLENIESSHFTLDTMSGDVELKNLTASNANINTLTADIELFNININNALNCSTLEGDIDLEKGFAQEFFFKTESGDFDGEEFYPNTISFNSISGDLDIKNKKTKHDIIIKSKQSIEGEIKLK